MMLLFPPRNLGVYFVFVTSYYHPLGIRFLCICKLLLILALLSEKRYSLVCERKVSSFIALSAVIEVIRERTRGGHPLQTNTELLRNVMLLTHYPSYIFILLSTRNIFFYILDALESHNISVWVDVVGLNAGVNFLNKIGQAIIDSKVGT